MLFQALNAPKLVFGRSSAPDPAVKLTTLLQDPRSVGEGETASLYPIDACGVSISPPQFMARPNNIPGYAYGPLPAAAAATLAV